MAHYIAKQQDMVLGEPGWTPRGRIHQLKRDMRNTKNTNRHITTRKGAEPFWTWVSIKINGMHCIRFRSLSHPLLGSLSARPTFRGLIRPAITTSSSVLDQTSLRTFAMLVPEPEFVTTVERSLVALSRDFSHETRSEIPSLWNEFWKCEWAASAREGQDTYGVCYNMQPGGNFSYAVGLEVTPVVPMPEGTCMVTLSAGSYAVFRKRGPTHEIPQLFDAIFGTWLPHSGKQQREGAVFERYPFSEDSSPEIMTYEIWMPVI
jgi:predicted transcriptional regulator YdeE